MVCKKDIFSPERSYLKGTLHLFKEIALCEGEDMAENAHRDKTIGTIIVHRVGADTYKDIVINTHKSFNTPFDGLLSCKLRKEIHVGVSFADGIVMGIAAGTSPCHGGKERNNKDERNKLLHKNMPFIRAGRNF